MHPPETTSLPVPCFLDFSDALAGRERMALGLGPALECGCSRWRARATTARSTRAVAASLYDGGLPRLRPRGAFRFESGPGRVWQPTWLSGRGPWLHGAEGTRCFRIHLDSLVALAGAGD